MRYPAKWLGLVAATVILLAEIPGFFEEPWDLMPPVTAQSIEPRQAEAEADTLQASEAERLLQQGLGQFNRSQFREALQSWEQALAIYRNLQNRGGEGRALGNLGLVYYRLGNSRQALDFYEQSLAIAREIGNYQGEGIVLESLGSIYFNLGDFRRAIEFFEQSLAIAYKIEDYQGQENALLSLGNAYLSLGDYPRAIDFYRQNLALTRRLKHRNGEGKALGSLGLVHTNLGNYRQALDFYEQSLAISRELGDRQGEGRTLGNLGLVYYRLGNNRRAIEFQEQSLMIARATDNRLGEGAALGNLGNVYLSLRDYRRAIDFFEQRLAIARRLEHPLGEANALGSLGLAYTNLGDHRRAIDFFEQNLTIVRELGDRQGEGNTLGNLGIAYKSLRDFRRAIEFGEQHRWLAREIGDRRSEGNALSNLGLAYLSTGQFALAETALSQALDIRDALRDSALPDADKISLFETQRNSFLLLQRALVAQGKIAPALEVAERGRGRAFAELLSQRLSTNETTLNPSSPNLDVIKTLAQQEQTTLVTYSLIRFIDDDYAALYIWVISPTGEVSFRRQPLDGVDLDSLVTTARQSLGVRGDRLATGALELTPDALARQQAETEANLRQLYDVLIAPIADLLPADPTQPVVFMPQDELFLVPFAALKAPNGQYLIENHTILTSPSIQVFGLATEANSRLNGGSAATRNPLIVGNPTMPSVTFLSESGSFQDVRLDPLPGAQREAEAISGFLQTPALLGRAATKAAVQQRMAEADVIHLATHGLLEYGDPRQTGTRDLPGAIALAPGDGEDGLLTAAEILQMNLRADLAVLSACDTGRGRITGDGVIGLSRAFVAAGVPSIIVSLWAVDDEATADLMVAFYNHWQQSGDKAQALRQAMLTTMESNPDPRLWSAFTLIGSPD